MPLSTSGCYLSEIFQLRKTSQEVLKVAGVILECMREEHASSAGP
jgi:hypothetical protein